MSTIGINLPDTLKAFIDKQVASGRYSDASAFMQSLLEAEVQRQIGREVEQMLLEVTDGPFEDWTEKDVEDIRRAGQRLIKRRTAR
jgi:antitoxin ParD1/3/4